MFSIEDARARKEGRKPQPRGRRSRLARPLITSLGVATILVSGTFVLLAASATGSTRPSDWTHLNWSLTSHYQVCSQRVSGLALIGCMFRVGTRPVLAADAPATQQKEAPIYSVATIKGQASAASQGAGHKHTVSGLPAGTRLPLVHIPANATRAQVDVACQAAMKTAQTQAPAVMREVEAECNDYEQELAEGPDE